MSRRWLPRLSRAKTWGELPRRERLGVWVFALLVFSGLLWSDLSGRVEVVTVLHLCAYGLGLLAGLPMAVSRSDVVQRVFMRPFWMLMLTGVVLGWFSSPY